VRAEIVAVGTELLLGQISNTNARWMSERLAEAGVDVHHHQVVGDNVERIVAALRIGLDRADVVLVTGGLGPTGDDVTREAIAEVLGVPLVRHPELEQMLREKFSVFGRSMPESNLQQADVPAGARYVAPERGTAPGLACRTADGTLLYAMAGVPAEMREMMDVAVIPELAERAEAVVRSRVIRCIGMGESAVAELLQDLFESLRNPTVAYLAGTAQVKVRLTAKAATGDAVEALLEPLVAEISGRLGDVVFSVDDEELEEVVGRLLRDAGKTLGCAESLTGGSLTAALTTVPGASAYVRGSIIAYAPEVKIGLLGVSPETIAGAGVVSQACAREMAAGARRTLGTDLGLAVTGAAGPQTHGDRPVGTVWIALDAGEVAHAFGTRLPGDREMVRRRTELAALDLLRRSLSGLALPGTDLRD
jgi:nicotinamide-nucleotide amidase